MIAENVRNVRQRVTSACQRIGQKPEYITLVAVSKTIGGSGIHEVMNSGVFDIGESYVQELRQKRVEIPDEKIRWHFIGHLQTNKVKYIAEWIHLIHSVDSLALGREISKYAGKFGRNVDVLLEANTSGEDTKYGVTADDARNILKELTQLPNINVTGLMTIGPLRQDPEESRQSFRALNELKKSLEQDGFHLPILSMGMTNDFEIAIEEGANMVRIGTAIFGNR